MAYCGLLWFLWKSAQREALITLPTGPFDVWGPLAGAARLSFQCRPQTRDNSQADHVLPYGRVTRADRSTKLQGLNVRGRWLVSSEGSWGVSLAHLAMRPWDRKGKVSCLECKNRNNDQSSCFAICKNSIWMICRAHIRHEQYMMVQSFLVIYLFLFGACILTQYLLTYSESQNFTLC